MRHLHSVWVSRFHFGRRPSVCCCCLKGGHHNDFWARQPHTKRSMFGAAIVHHNCLYPMSALVCASIRETASRSLSPQKMLKICRIYPPTNNGVCWGQAVLSHNCLSVWKMAHFLGSDPPPTMECILGLTSERSRQFESDLQQKFRCRNSGTDGSRLIRIQVPYKFISCLHNANLPTLSKIRIWIRNSVNSKFSVLKRETPVGGLTRWYLPVTTTSFIYSCHWGTSHLKLLLFFFFFLSCLFVASCK